VPASRLADRDSTLWVATQGKGLLQYDQHMKLLNHYPIETTNRQPNHDSVSCLYTDGGDSIWMATKTQVKIFNKTSGKLSDFSLNFKFETARIGNL
jgi:ligand-binding sensor domain-containing protein